jgi:spermidine synthase
VTGWTELAHATLPGGDRLTLRHKGSDFEIRFNLLELMSSRNPASERALADLACARLECRTAHVLIGGLGLGYTVRAMLDRLGPDARVTVAELVPEIVAWNRGPLAAGAGRPLEDVRVSVHCGDVGDLARASPAAFDAMLLDVDNGPDAVLFEGNEPLYTPAGIAGLLAALKPGGVLAFWSADRSPGFEQMLNAAGHSFERAAVAVEGVEHSLYLIGSPHGHPGESRDP